MSVLLCLQQSGDEKQRGDRRAYRSDVVLKVASEEEDEVMVEYPGEGHEEQEQDDPLAEDVARGALSSLSQIADKVFLPHKQVHQSGEGGRD